MKSKVHTVVLAMVCVIATYLVFLACSPLRINQRFLRLNIGETVILTVQGNFLTKGQAVWASTNTDVATVTNDGRVTAKTSGRAIVTADLAGKSVSCDIIVDGRTSEDGIVANCISVINSDDGKSSQIIVELDNELEWAADFQLIVNGHKKGIYYLQPKKITKVAIEADTTFEVDDVKIKVDNIRESTDLQRNTNFESTAVVNYKVKDGKAYGVLKYTGQDYLQPDSEVLILTKDINGNILNVRASSWWASKFNENREFTFDLGKAYKSYDHIEYYFINTYKDGDAH